MFYGEKLHAIREMFSYSRADLALELKVTEQMVWKFETNQEVPDFKAINILKNLFYVQSSYFFQKLMIKDISNTEFIAFRKNKTNNREGVKSEKIYLDHLFSYIQDLEKIVYPDPGSILSYFKKIESNYVLTDLSNDDIKQIAEQARTYLEIKSNERLMYYLELSGVYIVERKLENNVDAYSTWLQNNGYPVIVLNSRKKSAVRRNFDLGHELGHLLLHRYVDFDALDKDKMNRLEYEANLFSSYFMLPEVNFKKDFYEISDRTDPNDYLSLKKKYRMSIQSIAFRAYKEGWLSMEENSTFWKRINQLGYRQIEPLDDTLPIHIPGKIRSLLYHVSEIDQGFISEWLTIHAVDIKYFEMVFNIKDDLLSKHVVKGQKQSKNNVVNFNQF